MYQPTLSRTEAFSLLHPACGRKAREKQLTAPPMPHITGAVSGGGCNTVRRELWFLVEEVGGAVHRV